MSPAWRTPIPQEYQRYIHDLKDHYPDIWVRAGVGAGRSGESVSGNAKTLPLAACLLQVHPTQFGVVDSRTLFVAFEGRATDRTPMFRVRGALGDQPGCGRVGAPTCPSLFSLHPPASNCVQGVDLFFFNDDATKIREIEGEARWNLYVCRSAPWH